MMEIEVSATELAMKGRFAGVVKTVTVNPRRRMRRARWRSGMVWPFDMKGKRSA